MSPKSVFVAGAKAGIGFELVKQFASLENGPTHVFAAGRKVDQAKDLLSLANSHKNLHLIELDVANDQQIAAAVSKVAEVVGEEGLNLLINNAAILDPEGNHLPEISRNAINRHVDINSTSPLMVIQAFLPLLKKASAKQPSSPMSISKAAIVNISSDSGSLHTKVEFSASEFGFYGYVAGKAAMNIITKNLSFDLKNDGILIVGLCPGYVETDMTKHMLAQVRQKYGKDAVPEFLLEYNMVTPAESVSQIMGMLKRIGDKQTGGYFKRNGEKLEDYDFEGASA